MWLVVIVDACYPDEYRAIEWSSSRIDRAEKTTRLRRPLECLSDFQPKILEFGRDVF
jgi:hypothetical protein